MDAHLAAVTGENDSYFTDMVLTLSQAMARSRVVNIPGTGHLLNLEVPGVVNEMLGRILSDTDRQ